MLAACSKKPADKEPTVSVQAVAAEKTTLQQTVFAQAVLFPLQQAAITPKISAPVHKFFVNRGSKVHKDQLLARWKIATWLLPRKKIKEPSIRLKRPMKRQRVPAFRRNCRKHNWTSKAQRKRWTRRRRSIAAAQELFKQGALPRKELDQSGVDLTQARNQYDIAQKHFDALQAIGKQQALKSAAGQLQAAKGKYMGAEAQLSYSEIRSPIDGFVTDRPLYPGEMAAAGTGPHNGDGHVAGDRQGAHPADPMLPC